MRRHLMVNASVSFVTGVIFGVVLVIAFESAVPIRSAVAAAWFPYVTSLRFGITGAVLFWLMLDIIAIGTTAWIMIRLSNLTMRSSGP